MFILHLSDIHIRTGDIIKCRYTEYYDVFSKLIAHIKNVYKKSDLICVITGDIFHHKNKIEASGIILFKFLLTELCNHCSHVYLIRGNHDYKQECPEEPDLIGSLISHLAHMNLTYFDKSGAYRSLSSPDISFGLQAIQDDMLEEFPTPLETKWKVALFHGQISKKNVNIKGYDIALLGDIHLQQVIGGKCENVQKPQAVSENISLLQKYSFKDTFVMAYAGSMIQQDFSEPILGHGFLIWDLEERVVSCFQIHNNHGFVTIDDCNKVHLRYCDANTWLDIDVCSSVKWFPKNIRVRGASIANAESECMKHGLNVESSSIFNSKSKAVDCLIDLDKDSCAGVIQLCSADNWIKYIKTNPNLNLPCSEWENWLKEPNLTLRAILPSTLSKERTDRISKRIDAYLDGIQRNVVHSLKILSMSWEYILCFKGSNHFDFTQMDKSISILNGKNGTGKTSFLECITIGLFGEGFPSRYNKNYTSSIINNEKPSHSAAYVILDILSNKNVFTIKRTYHTQEEKSKIHAASKDTYIKEKESGVIVAKGKTAVDKWVASHVGTIDSFLMSCMLTQSIDGDFFNLSYSEQKNMLDKSMNLDGHSLMVDLLKEVKLGLSYRFAILQEKNSDSEQPNFDSSLSKLFEKRSILESRRKKYELETFPSNVLTREQALMILEENVIDDTCIDDNVSIEEAEFILKKLSKYKFESIGKPLKSVEDALYDYEISEHLDASVIRNQDPLNHETSLEEHMLCMPPKPKYSGEIDLEYNEKRFQELQYINNFPFDEKRYLELNTKDLKPIQEEIERPNFIKKEWTNEMFDKLSDEVDYDFSDESIDELTKYRDSLVKKLGKRQEAEKGLIVANDVIKTYHHYPFNPECSACKSAPWKVHLNEHIESKNKHEKILHKIGNVNEIESEIKTIDVQIKKLRELNHMKPALDYIAHCEYKEFNKLKTKKEFIQLKYLKEKAEWDLWNQKYSDLIHQKILKHGTFEENAKILAYWKHFYETIHKRLLYNSRIELAKKSLVFHEIKQIDKEIFDTSIDIARIEMHQKFESEKEAVLKERQDISLKITTLESILNALSNYQTWIYKDQILPLICKSVNDILDVMQLEKHLRLNCKFYVDGNSMDWFLGCAPISRASGFQKFICSLGMRIALSRIGASEIRNKQLFLDEGFTACDTENLQKVPDFLRGLLFIYDSVLLVSHLEELKDNVDRCFDVLKKK